MAKTVYILTQEGRGYTDEGLEILRDQIYEIFQDGSDLLFIAGQILNDPDKLIRLLSNDKNGYLALSMENGVYYYHADDFQDLISVIEKYHDENPWEILNRLVIAKLGNDPEKED